jgi:hypothetical protein
MLNRHRRKRVLNVRHRAVGSYICAASARGDESCGPQRRENWSLVHPVYVTHGRLKRGGPAMLNKQRLHRQASKSSLAWQGDDLFREGICTR